MDEFLKLLTESPDNEALVKMLTRGMQGSVMSDDIGGNLLKTGLSTAGTAAFGPIGGVAGTVLGQLLVPNKQEPQPINPRVQRNLNPYGMATGGMVQNGQGLVPVEVEGDEMYELPNGQVGEFQGPDHEQGGIPTQLPPGTNVYSKRMTGADGRSMADRKESRERRLRKILAQLDKRPTDAPTINSVSREVNRIQAEEEQDMQIMQMYQLRDMLAQARQGQMQGQMSPEMMQGQMPQEMPMMRGGGKVDPRLGTGRDMANINKVAPEVAPNQIDLIHQYHKGKGDVYQILDKAGGKRTFYRDGEELFTHPVLVGANEGDDPTMTVLNEGGGGVDWEAGNKMTGAGVFEVSKAQKRNSNYQNAPFYVYKNVATGKNIRSSDHAVLGSRRARLQDDDFTNNRMTNGCVNANCDDLKEVYNAGYGVGNRRYVLPEDGYNYFDMEDGEIVMKTRYTGGDLPEVTVTAERPSVIGMSPQLVEMPRESTAVNMPMMQAGGVIGNNPNNIDNEAPPFDYSNTVMPRDNTNVVILQENYDDLNEEKEYIRFKNTLPPNLRDTDETYDMKYLWKHGGKPKSFEESINRKNPMFSLGENGKYHGGSVEPNTGRFVKRYNHETIQKELDWYYSDENKDFRRKYYLDKSGEFYRYVPRESTAVNMPMMQAGGVIRNGNTMNGFTDLAMLLGGYNKMQNGGIANFDKKTGNVAGLQQFLAEQGYDMSSSRKKDGTYDGVWGKSTEAAYNDYIVTKKRERAEGAKIFDIPKLPFQIEYDNEVNRLKSLSDNESWQQLSDLDRALLESRFQRKIISKEAEERGYRDSNAYFADLVQDFDPQGMQSIFDNYKKYMDKSDASPLTEFPQEPDYLEQRRLDATETAKGLKELGNFFNMQMQSGGVIPNTQNNTGFTDLAMLLGGYNKMAAGGTTPNFDMYNFDKTDPEQVKIVQERLANLGYEMNKSRKADGTYDGVWTDTGQTAEAYKDWKAKKASGPSFFEERLRLNQDLFERRRNPSDYEIPFAPPPIEPGFTGYGLDGEPMPQTELATGIPSSEVVTDFLPNAQDATRDELLAQLDELNNEEFYIRNLGNEKINKEDDESVKRAQRALQNKGYDVGPDGADGDWGENTQKAYDQYIKDKEPRLNELAQQKKPLAAPINETVGSTPETTYQLESTSKTPPVDIDALLAESRTEPLPKTPEEKTEPTWKIDPLTRAGYITSGAGPLITTILNRLGDEPTPNFYANFGRDAERALDAAERGIAGSRDRAYEENRLAQNLRGRQARNAARSSNVMQAMQQAALTSGMKANEQITGQYQNALRALLANRAQFEQGQDQAIMKGREAAYTADLQNRDQFSTNLASNLANAGSMMQTLGRQKEVFDVYNQIGKSGGDATKNTLLDQLMSLYSIGGENKKDTTK